MTVKLLTTDAAVLPAALLVQAKQHMRVVDNDDDALITSILARSISGFQNRNDVMLNPSTVLWKPSAAEFKDGAATIPARPVTSFTATAGTPPIDAAANYVVELKWNSITGVPIQVLRGAFADGLALTLTIGMATVAELGAGVLDIVLRYAAHLYEHREIFVIGGRGYSEPDLRIDATFWVPRV